MSNLSFRDVKKTYPGGVAVIHGVSTEVSDGEFIVIVGPSGCGKSTLLRMVAGLEAITEGEIALYFGDFSGLALKTTEQLEIQVLREKYATQHATGIVAWTEMDAKIENHQKLAGLSIKETA